jgi:tetratricopeptide (TPR) repeat protein
MSPPLQIGVVRTWKLSRHGSQIATKFRARVGESLTTVEKHSTPLPEATTTSLEALKAYSVAWKVLSSSGDVAALPHFKRAVEIDPKFAMAHVMLGITYSVSGEFGLSSESATTAYRLRDRTSDRERFFITAYYDINVTGNLEKAQQTCELWAQTYPREVVPHTFLAGMIYPVLGKYEKAVERSRQAIGLNPDFAIAYYQLSFNSQYLNRLGDAENALQRAAERKLEIPEHLLQRYDLAFLKGDRAGMSGAVTLSLVKSGVEDLIADRQAFVLAYAGQLKQAEGMARRAAELNQQPSQRGKKALLQIGPALWNAFFGDAPAARQSAMSALALSKDRDVEYGAAFALALSGESSRSEKLAEDLEKRFPEDTPVRSVYLPAIRALLALNAKQPSKAIELLQLGLTYDRGAPPCSAPAFFGNFYTIYVRGLAYLAAHQGAEAAAEYQKILDGRAIVVSDPIGALAHLQSARAFALLGDKAKAKTAYQDFLTLWKDADPDIPIFKQAKAEYAALE